MIDKKQALLDIQQMSVKQRYNHVLSCLDTVLNKAGGEAHKDATVIIRLHVKVARESMMETAKISYW